MSGADWIWGGLLALGAVVEVVALWTPKKGDTLSERTRAWFRVRTPVGKAVFVAAWVGFAGWFLVHIAW
ncbi:hypothetical protein OG946_09225 [Streptomyces sp. NBC_01808]|uniref:hypothetical protein n=1 Tax=Streptomyces sp. NBC_01808 TaxID=2975947 RepID=UPI002DDA66E8|nr:hypothetical protein [Streptomyces sp. NBC_01808]WSA37549.1 hypothetical protein OG946_09225 [Streptomyces sp. NBC_01808]